MMKDIYLSGDMCDHLWFIGVSCGSHYKNRPPGENRIEVVCEFKTPHCERMASDDNTDFIKWMGVHVKCICCPTPSMWQDWAKDEASLNTCYLRHFYSTSSSSSSSFCKQHINMI